MEMGDWAKRLRPFVDELPGIFLSKSFDGFQYSSDRRILVYKQNV
jgi:hypothetical protein